MATTIPPADPWLHATVLPATEGDSLDSLDYGQVEQAFIAYGAILFRGFRNSVTSFASFAEQFCVGSVFNESPGRTVVDRKRNIQSTDIGSDAFPLHPELSREPWRPDVCFFACLNPPTRGGETTIGDGVEIVKRMPAKVFDAFHQRRLLYLQPTSPQQCEYWLGTPNPDQDALDNPPDNCPFEFSRHDEVLIRSFTRPALQKTMFSSDLAFANFLLFARGLLKQDSIPVFDNWRIIPQWLVDELSDICKPITVPISWQSGDLLMLDNSRFMHGRNEVLDLKERNIISYFGYLTFARPCEDEPVNAPWRLPDFVVPHN